MKWLWPPLRYRIGCLALPASHELLEAVLPIINELVSAKEKHRADGRLIEPGGVEHVGNGRSRARVISRGKVNLCDSTIGKGNVDLHKEVESGEWAALAKTGLGLPGPGDGAPNEALIFSKLPPAFGDRAESPTNSDLGRGAGIVRDKGRVSEREEAGAEIINECINVFGIPGLPRPIPAHHASRLLLPKLPSLDFGL